MNYEEIIKGLPNNWDEIKLHQFKELLKLTVSEGGNEYDDLYIGVENSLKVLSVLSGIEVSVLEEFPLEVNIEMVDKISFTFTELIPENCKTNLKLKPLEKITYDDFILFKTIADKPYDNINQILRTFIEPTIVNGEKVKMTDEEIDNLSVVDFNAAFFLLARKLKKYIRSLTQKTAKKLVKQTMRELLQVVFRRN